MIQPKLFIASLNFGKVGYFKFIQGFEKDVFEMGGRNNDFRDLR